MRKIYPAFVVSLLVTSIASAAPPVNLGLYSAATGEFQISTGFGNPPITSFSFGVGGPGAVPIIGDWNGDGWDTVGLYNPSSSTFYLKNSNTSGAADIVFSFGTVGGGVQQPVMGDWNNDGIDTVALYDSASSTFYLKNSNTSGAADIVFSFGAPGGGAVPIIGDWNGDGIDTVALYDSASSTFYLKNSNTPGAADIVFSFGAPGGGAVPIIGDWDNNGDDTAGLYNFPSGAGTFYLRNSNTTGPADITVNFGDSSTLPLVFGVVPEPSTICLVALSCATILMRRTRWQ